MSFFNLEALNIADGETEVIGSSEIVEGTVVQGEGNEAFTLEEESGTLPLDGKGEVGENQDREDLLDVDKAERGLNDGTFSETITPFAKFLEERGFINLKDKDGNLKEVKDFDTLGEIFKESIESNRYGELNDSQTRYLEALKEGIPLTEFEKVERTIKQFDVLTPDTLEKDMQLRFDILYQDQVAKGQTELMAHKIANILVKENNSLDTALDIVNTSKQGYVEQYKQLLEETKKSNRVNAEAVENTLKEKNSILGMELTEVMKNKIKTNMLTRAGQNERGEALNAFDNWRNTNKVEADIILNALMVYTDNFTNLGKVKNTVKSNVVSELESVLKKSAFKPDDKTFIVNNEELKLI